MTAGRPARLAGVALVAALLATTVLVSPAAAGDSRQYDVYGSGSPGYAPLVVVNDTGWLVTVVDSSGAWEMPGELTLRPGESVRTGWHWSHVALNEWFVLKVGNYRTHTRVQYGFWGVDCRFWDSSRPYEEDVPLIGNGLGGWVQRWSFDSSTFECVNGKGDGRYVGRGTPDDQSVLTLRLK